MKGPRVSGALFYIYSHVGYDAKMIELGNV